MSSSEDLRNGTLLGKNLKTMFTSQNLIRQYLRVTMFMLIIPILFLFLLHRLPTTARENLNMNEQAKEILN